MDQGLEADPEYNALLAGLRKQNQKPSNQNLPNQKPVPPQPEETASYDRFLNIILTGQHPDHCKVIWDGEKPLIEFTIPFERHESENAQVIRRRAYNYFRQYGLSEQKIVKFEVHCSKGRSHHAVVSVLPDAAAVVKVIGTTRLKELAQDPRGPTLKR